MNKYILIISLSMASYFLASVAFASEAASSGSGRHIPSMSGTLEMAEDFAPEDPEDSLKFSRLQKSMTPEIASPAAPVVRSPASVADMSSGD